VFCNIQRSDFWQVAAVIQKMRREGSGPDFNTFMYSTASILTIRRALFPLDAQVEIKVLAKIQVFFILRCCAMVVSSHIIVTDIYFLQGPLAQDSNNSRIMEKALGKKRQIIP
jgi:uncharacterized membrane protein